MDDNTIEIPVKQVKKTRTSCDCPSTVFLICNIEHLKKHMKGIKTLDLFNSHSFILQPLQIKIIFFNNTLITSLPAVCLLYGSQYLYKKGISYKINLIKTNDNYLNIIIWNHTKQPINVNKNELHFIGTIVIPGPTLFATNTSS